MASVIPQNSRATAEDWTVHRALITDLYINQGKKLKEVKSSMEKEHRFFSSVKAYKTHIARWGLRKNLGPHVVGALLRQQRSQTSDANASQGPAHGQAVPPRVRKYLSRVSEATYEQVISIAAHSMESEETRRTTDSIPTVSSGKASLTHATKIPGRLEAPDDLKMLESSIHIIKNYLSGVADSQTWKVDAYGAICNKDDQRFTYASTSWIRQVCLARSLIAGGRTDRGFQMLNICFDQFKVLLLEHRPNMLLDTYRAVFILASMDLRLARSFLAYVSGITKYGHLANHPLGPLLARFQETQVRGLALHSRNVAECIVETAVPFFPSIASLHHILLGTEDDVWGLGDKKVGYDVVVPATDIIRGTVRGLTNALGARAPPIPDYPETVFLRHFHASILYNRGDLERSRKIAEDSLCQYDKRPVDHGKEICYYLLYSIYSKEGQREKALVAAQERAKICVELYGSAHIITAGAYGQLEESLRGMGRYKEAKQVRHEGDSQWEELCARLSTEFRL